MQQIALWTAQSSNSSGLESSRSQASNGEFKNTFNSAVDETQQGSAGNPSGQGAARKAIDSVSRVEAQGKVQDKANEPGIVGQNESTSAASGQNAAAGSPIDGTSLPFSADVENESGAVDQNGAALGKQSGLAGDFFEMAETPAKGFAALSNGLVNGGADSVATNLAAALATVSAPADRAGLQQTLINNGVNGSALPGTLLTGKEGTLDSSGSFGVRADASVSSVNGVDLAALEKLLAARGNETPGSVAIASGFVGRVQGALSSLSGEGRAELEALLAQAKSQGADGSGTGMREAALGLAQALSPDAAAGNRAFAGSMVNDPGLATGKVLEPGVKALGVGSSDLGSGLASTTAASSLASKSADGLNLPSGASNNMPPAQGVGGLVSGATPTALSEQAPVSGLGLANSGSQRSLGGKLAASELPASGLAPATTDGSIDGPDNLSLAPEQLKPVSQTHGAVKTALESAVSAASNSDLGGANDALVEVSPKVDVSVSKTLDPNSRDQNVGLRPYVSTLGVPVDDAEWADQLSQKLAFLHSRNITSTELHLNPADLGPIDVRINMNGDQTTINFTSQNATVRELLEANIHRLREMLTDPSNPQNSSGGFAQNSEQQADGFAEQRGQKDGFSFGTSESRTDEVASSAQAKKPDANEHIVDAYI
jgi:flagellar hook-length control protein FliK